MNVEELLRSTIPMLNAMHVLGAETHIMEGVKKNIKTAIAAIDLVKKEEENRGDHDEQRESV